MTRLVLSSKNIHSDIIESVGGNQEYRHIVASIQKAIEEHAVVIVGMAQNPFPKKARRLLDSINVSYHYVEYGNYLSQWHLRGAIKMWSGWQTFPMIFIKGQLIGGFSDLKKLQDTKQLSVLLPS